MSTVVALLDPPSPSSFAVVPFVAGEDTGAFSIYGLTGRPSRQLDAADLEELVQQGHAVRVDSVPLPAEAREDWAAGWAGDDFLRNASRLRAPQVSIPPDAHRLEAQGSFWVAPREEIYALLDGWLREAAKDCFEQGSVKADLAALMQWVLPGRLEAQAALWYTRPSEQERKRELDWQVRIRRDLGKVVSPRELEDSFRRVAGEFQSRLSQAVAGRSRLVSRR